MNQDNDLINKTSNIQELCDLLNAKFEGVYIAKKSFPESIDLDNLPKFSTAPPKGLDLTGVYSWNENSFIVCNECYFFEVWKNEKCAICGEYVDSVYCPH